MALKGVGWTVASEDYQLIIKRPNPLAVPKVVPDSMAWEDVNHVGPSRCAVQSSPCEFQKHAIGDHANGWRFHTLGVNKQVIPFIHVTRYFSGGCPKFKRGQCRNETM